MLFRFFLYRKINQKILIRSHPHDVAITQEAPNYSRQ